MASFFKTFFLGMLITLLLPFIALLFAIFFVYCLIVFIYMSIRSIIIYFAGGRPLGDLPEDVKAKELIAKRFETQAANAQPPQMGNNIVINNPNINYVSSDTKPTMNGLINSSVAPSIDVKSIENDVQENPNLVEEKVENND